MIVTNALRRGLTGLAYPILWMIVAVNLTYDGNESSKMSQVIVLR